jgi:hypothetical protein
MGQPVLHRSERRRVAAICAAALNEREAQARHKTPKPSSSQRGCREFTHKNDSYRDLFEGSAFGRNTPAVDLGPQSEGLLPLALRLGEIKGKLLRPDWR